MQTSPSFAGVPVPLLVIVAAGLICAALLVAIRPLLARYAMARPNARSSHRVPTPQGAGIAVIAATLAAAGAVIVTYEPGSTAWLGLVVGATLLIATVGAVDDLRPIPVLPRLLLQAIAVALVLSAIPQDARLTPALPWWLERGGLLLAGLWFVNLVNFMDGLDWMTVAEAVPVTAALVLLAALGEMSWQAGIVAAALGGALSGFAPFNKPVAKVFLGDVGSLPIGLLLGWCLLDLALAGHLVAALLLPLYYLADATLTLLRRIVRREPFWIAHRSHFYQRATDNGFAVLQVVSEVYILNATLAMLALIAVVIDTTLADVVALAAGCAAVTLVLVHFSLLRAAPPADQSTAGPL